MCGIFAYQGPAASRSLLPLIAGEAARRGPHGHGWVILAPGADPVVHRQLGPLNGDSNLLARIRPDATTVLGHARLATQGAAPADPDGLQPLGYAGHWLAHNGNVYNPAELAPGRHVSDSAAVLAAYAAARDRLDPAAALRLVMTRARTEASVVLVADAAGTLVAAKRHLPLFVLSTAHVGVYLSSRQFPGAEPVPDGIFSWARTVAA